MDNLLETKKIKGYNVNIFIEDHLYKKLKEIVKNNKTDIETYINLIINKELEERNIKYE